jgi:hypothetical protein
MGGRQSRELAALRADNARLQAEVASLRASQHASPTAAGAAAEAPAAADEPPPRAPPQPPPAAAAGSPCRAAPQRAAACFESLPLSVTVHILSLLPPADVFAAARTCRVARAASRAAGAFVHVDLSALDAPLWDARWHSAFARGGGTAALAMPSSASAFVAFLAGCDAAAGIRTLVLSRQHNSDATCAGVCALLARCAALQRLLDVRAWPAEEAERILAAAAATPLAHTHVNRVPPALRLLPRLSSLRVSHSDHGATLRLDVPALEALLAQSRTLERLELDVALFTVTPLAVRSPTLRSLALGGKNLHVRALACPQLACFDMSSAAVGMGTKHANKDSVVCAAALAIMRGCPRIDWRAGAAAAAAAEAAQSAEEAHSRALTARAWGKMLRRRRSRDLAGLQEDTVALETDAHAVRFAHGLLSRPIVDGRMRWRGDGSEP